MVRRHTPWRHRRDGTHDGQNGHNGTAAAAAAAAASADGASRPSTDPLQRALRSFNLRLPQLRTELACLAAVQTDRLRSMASRTLGRLMAGSFLVLTMAALTAVATSMVLFGIAGGLERWFGGTPWLALLLTGSAALCTLFAALLLTLRWHERERLEQLRARYDQLRGGSKATPQPQPATATAAATAGSHGR